MNKQRFAQLARRNKDVLSLADLHEARISQATASRRVRDGDWQRLLPGVVLVSRGRPSFDQKIIAALKWSGPRPVVFHLHTAAYMHRLIRKPPREVQLLMPVQSRLRTPSHDMVRVTKTRRMIQGIGDPPRTALVHTVADLIHTAPTEGEALEIMINAIRNRLSTQRFVAEVAKRKLFRHRRFIGQLLDLPKEGIESHLELAYVRDVERAHGLPRSIGQRQELIRGRWIRSDRWYREFKIRCELDGELAHPGRMTDTDIMRDNDVRVLLDETTFRYRWPQVINLPCDVATQIAHALQVRGWIGTPRRCSNLCDIDVQLALAQGRSP